jgi:hypothetical protein
MPSYKQGDATHSYEQNVDARPENYAWSEWLVYPKYEIGEHEGYKYVYAPMTEPAKQLHGRMRYRPLSRPTAALFLEFARWPEKEGMDRKPLGSERNEAAALEWVEIYGVLGLSSSHGFTVFDEAAGAVKHSLGVAAIRPRTRNEGYGGFEETVEAFAREGWLANMTLRLYEAATNPESPDVDSIAAYMPNQKDRFMDHLPTTQELHSKTPEAARQWALTVVEEIVEDRTRRSIWPIPVRHHSEGGGYAGHKQGWAFDSLLGAVWLQMMWLMLGQPRRCEWCRRLLDVDPQQDLQPTEDAAASGKAGSRKPPSHKRFCSDTRGRCRSNWNHHYGTGKSSKVAKKEKRDRERGKG